MPKTQILLDTDPGTDIDDACAIAYLLAHPDAELVGITTVTGDTCQRAAIAEVLCNAAGRSDIPIIAGHCGPLGNGPGQNHVPQYPPIQHLPHHLDRPVGEAVHFMRETIRSRPGEITLLTIGPMTNIGLLFALDPEIPILLKDYVSMAGWFFGQHDHLETNCKVDPLSTAIISHSRRANHKWIGLDVTFQCTMPRDEVKSRFKGPLLELVSLMSDAWFLHSPNITFHDPLAAATIFHPELCTYQPGRVVIDPKDGASYFEPGNGPDKVADTVQRDAFFERFFSVF
ncbi:MAG: nucleoside hydrolase [Armatimonadetes bacterium]|nr:nucleoside hydrolase [Armatimonadota bacterium]